MEDKARRRIVRDVLPHLLFSLGPTVQGLVALAGPIRRRLSTTGTSRAQQFGHGEAAGHAPPRRSTPRVLAVVTAAAVMAALLVVERAASPAVAQASTKASAPVPQTQAGLSTAGVDCGNGQASFDFAEPVKNAQLIVTLSLAHDMIIEGRFLDAHGGERFFEDQLVGDYHGGLPPTQFKIPNAGLPISNVARVDFRAHGGSLEDILTCTVQVNHEGPLNDPHSVECLTTGTMTFDFGAPRNDVRLSIELALNHDILLEWTFYNAEGTKVAGDFNPIGDYFGGLPLQTFSRPEANFPAVSGVTRAVVRLYARPVSTIRWCAGEAQFGGGAGPPARDLRFLQFNMYGGWGHRGRWDVADRTAESISVLRPDIVTLNEVCFQQSERVKQQLQNEYPMEKRFLGSNPKKNRCPRGENVGNAILFRGNLLGEPEHYKLSGRSGAERDGGNRMLCVRGALGGDMGRTIRGCVTHLLALPNRPKDPLSCNDPTKKPNVNTPDARIIQQQIREVAAIVGPQAQSGMPTVVGGDFNTDARNPIERTWLDPLINMGFGDVDAQELPSPTWSVARRCGPRHKLDYIFLSRQFKSLSASVSDPARDCGPHWWSREWCSDHRLLKGFATLTQGQSAAVMGSR